MAENTIPFRSGKEDGSDVTDRVRSQINEMIDSLDFPELLRRVQTFGRENPVGLGFAALTIGLAAGMLMRNRTSGSSSSPTRSPASPSGSSPDTSGFHH